jgi:hypothetical protein
MDYFEDKAESAQEPEVLPDWVNKSTKSYDAYLALHEIKADRLDYIRGHINKSAYKSKFRSFQINGSQVADRASMSKVTLTSSASYSGGFNDELDDVNDFLELAKEARLKKDTPKETKTGKKPDTIASLRRELKQAEKANVREQVTASLDHLNDEIKKILLLPVVESKANIIKFPK